VAMPCQAQRCWSRSDAVRGYDVQVSKAIYCGTSHDAQLSSSLETIVQ